MRVAALAGVFAALPLAGWAQDYVPSGQCALVVASRETIREAHEFMRLHPSLDYEGIYRSENGWYAIVSTMLAKPAASTIEAMKARGDVPPDSYCSNGSMYVARSWQPAQSPQPSDYDYSLAIDAPFDARPLAVQDKRFLQAAMAWKGYYNALLDGIWGDGTHAAFEDAAWSEYELADVNAAAAMLALEFIDELSENQWEAKYFPQFGLSLQMPMGLLYEKDRDSNFLEFGNAAQSLSVVLGKHDRRVLEALHSQTLGEHALGASPYTLRRNDRWVTTARFDGRTHYLRSDYESGWGWVSVSIYFADHLAPGPAPLMISSVGQGAAKSLSIELDGHLDRVVMRLINEFEAFESEGAQVDPPPQPRTSSAPSPQPRSGDGEEQTGGTGTGFFVAADGTVMTNSHVISGCSQVTVDGAPATVTAESESFDLAFLETDTGRASGEYLKFAAEAAQLNEDVTVAGFPLADILGGLNITRGSVSSLEGIGGDSVTLQISAPIQPGNSGGPLVDRYGNVVGVVVAKLDDLNALAASGSIPQNVNFAVRGEIAKVFANIHSIKLTEADGGKELAPEVLASFLQNATVLVECSN